MNERERIMQVMAQKGFTSSQFAEAIGIQRAAMSHITSGRNNPSLDVMKKILGRFPDISSDWLLLEKGPMNRVTQPPAVPPNPKERTADLFSAPPPPPTTAAPPTTSERIPKTEIPPSSQPDASLLPATESADRPKQIVREVQRIMIFYSDGTFESFIPEQR